MKQAEEKFNFFGLQTFYYIVNHIMHKQIIKPARDHSLLEPPLKAAVKVFLFLVAKKHPSTLTRPYMGKVQFYKDNDQKPPFDAKLFFVISATF